MIFTDTHTHLYADEFEADIEEVVQRAYAQQVNYLFLPAIDKAYNERLVALCEKYPSSCFPMIGLHPGSVKEGNDEEMNEVYNWIEKRKFCAIGEIGIDLYWDKTFFQQQQDIFKKQLDLAVKYGLPVVIHSRNSFEEIWRIMEKYNNTSLTGIFHCFSGNMDQAKRVISKGFKIGVGGVVTYKKSGLQDIVAAVDLSNLVLETDSPYLSPFPYRGKRNESSYIPLIAAKIAELKNISIEEVAETTTKTALQLFGIGN